ncbi:MAG: hypothetical protein KGR26_00920 [Cyanobacteria bacterium REEB65]|nr:hypothetical protein [Cyanobacteria bacterium REEB65]
MATSSSHEQPVRRLWQFAVMAWLVVLLAACSRAVLHLTAPGDVAPAGAPAAGGNSSAVLSGAGAAARANASRTVPAPAAPRYLGTLTLLVRWPDRPTDGAPGLQTQTLPLSTNALVVTVSSPSGTPVVPTVTQTRPASGSLSQITVSDIPAANGLSVDVKAYSDAVVTATSSVVAEGTAVVNIQPSQDSAASVALVPTNVPAISAFSVNSGVPGDTVTLSGLNLGLLPASTISVAFAGATASAVTPLSSTSVQVIVPQGATTGNVVVVNDGVTSASNAVFWVPQSIAITAATASWAGHSLAPGMVHYGGQLQFFANVSWLLAPGATWSSTLTPPEPTWTSSVPSGPDAIDAQGLFTAATTHATASVMAAISSVQSVPIVADPVGVDQVLLSPSSGIALYGILPGQAPAPEFAASVSATVSATVESTLPFNDGVNWSVSDPTILAIAGSTSSVRLSGVPGGPAGVVTVTAAASDDPTVSVGTSIQLLNMANVNLLVQ